MTPEKMSAARSAIDRFVYDLLGPDDELFFMQFANRPDLVQEWTTDRRRISRAVASVGAQGGTAMYDAIADAVPVAQEGKNRKKAILVISDGNDTNSGTSVGELRQMIRESEVLVYALGVDGTETSARRRPTIQLPPIAIPFPIPGPRRDAADRRWVGRHLDTRRRRACERRCAAPDHRRHRRAHRDRARVPRSRRRDRTDRRRAEQAVPTLATRATGDKDGRWHAIRVEVKDRRLTVRARRGYVAS